MDKLVVLGLLSAVHSYIIPHAHPFTPIGPGKVFVPYPTYVGHIPLGHPHVVQTPVFVIPHHPHPGGQPAFPGSGPDGHPGDVPLFPPQFPGLPGSFPNGGPGIVVPPPPEEPKPEGVPQPGDAPKPQEPECTLCGGGGSGGGNGNGAAGPAPDEGGRGDEEPSPGDLTPKGGQPETEPKPEEPKPEEPAPEPKPEEEPKPAEEPKPEEAAPEEPKPEEPQPEEPATEEPKAEVPTTEAPAADEPKIEEPMPEREGPEPGEEKSSEEEETRQTEAPASARLQFAKKATTPATSELGKAVAFRKSSVRRKPGALPAALRVIPVLSFYRGLPYTQPVLASPTHFEKQKGGRKSQGDGRYIFGYLVPAHGPVAPFPAGVIQKPVQALVRLQG